MFELSITNNINSPFINTPENKYGFSNEFHESISYDNLHIKISGLRFKDEKDDLFENDEYFMALVGKVFYRIANSSNLGFVKAEEILTQYIINKETFIDHFKGNFIISIYNKKEDSLFVVKDILGLKYLYYKSENGFFYISTNLNDFKQVTKKINYAAIIEKMLFTYPIGEESYLEGVFLLNGGERLSSTNGQFRKDTYSTIDSIFKHQLPLKEFDNQKFLDIFEKSVLQRAWVSSNINVSLTGGFDGRSNIAVLLNHDKKFHSYSFGKKGGENTEVPLQVARKLGLDYEPIFLDENYENNYAQCALDAIYFSDGISPFERANYIYALKILANNAHYNITGLIGGEIFAPVHQKTDYINATYFDVVYQGMDFSIYKLLEQKGIRRFINIEIIDNKQTSQKIVADIEERRKAVNDWKNDELNWLFYIKDLMSLGFRQFYGNQMHLERYFNENLTPFYDIDLMEYLFSTRHVNVYKNAFKDSPLLRRNNRKLQTLIINHFSKELAAISVDRGYPPIYSKGLRQLLIPYLFYERQIKRKNSIPEFDSPLWSNILYMELKKQTYCFSEDLLDIAKTNEILRNYQKKDYNKNFNQMLSIAIWLKQ